MSRVGRVSMISVSSWCIVAPPIRGHKPRQALSVCERPARPSLIKRGSVRGMEFENGRQKRTLRRLRGDEIGLPDLTNAIGDKAILLRADDTVIGGAKIRSTPRQKVAMCRYQSLLQKQLAQRAEFIHFSFWLFANQRTT